MRIILVQNTELMDQIASKHLTVRAGQLEQLEKGTNVVLLPFDVKTIDGKRLEDFQFSIDESLANEGIVLVGAYVQEKLLKVVLYKLSSESFALEPGEPVLKAFAYEPVSLRQASALVSEVPRKKPRGKRR